MAAYAVDTTPGKDPGQTAAVLDYKATDARGQPVAQAETTFNLPQLPFAWSWQALPVVDWTNPRAVSVVHQFLQEFSARLKQGDTNWIVNALTPKMTAYGYDIRHEIAEPGGRMQRRVADPTFAMTPFTDADLALRPCAGGKLVDCVIKSGEPAIRWKDARAGANGMMMLRVRYSAQKLLTYR